jgi:drug/metabolite transporter (DMT)-like permease
MRPSNTVGYFVLTLAQLAISINVIVSKFLLTTMPMFMLLSYRFFLSTLLLGALLLISRTPLKAPQHPESKLTTSDWVFMILQGIFAAFLFNLFFVWGLQHTTATAAGIVGSTLPAMIAICAVWMLKEHLNSAKVISIALAMLGILVINLDYFDASNTQEHSYFGDFLVLLAMLPEAWYSIIGRKLANRVTPLGAAFIANLVGFATLFPCALITGTFEIRQFTPAEMGLLLAAGASALIFFWAWGWGLRFIPASTAAVFGGVMPVATTLFAVMLLEEQIHWYDSLGMLLVVLSIIIGTGFRWGWNKNQIKIRKPQSLG